MVPKILKKRHFFNKGTDLTINDSNEAAVKARSDNVQGFTAERLSENSNKLKDVSSKNSEVIVIQEENSSHKSSEQNSSSNSHVKYDSRKRNVESLSNDNDLSSLNKKFLKHDNLNKYESRRIYDDDDRVLNNVHNVIEPSKIYEGDHNINSSHRREHSVVNYENSAYQFNRLHGNPWHAMQRASCPMPQYVMPNMNDLHHLRKHDPSGYYPYANGLHINHPSINHLNMHTMYRNPHYVNDVLLNHEDQYMNEYRSGIHHSRLTNNLHHKYVPASYYPEDVQNPEILPRIPDPYMQPSYNQVQKKAPDKYLIKPFSDSSNEVGSDIIELSDSDDDKVDVEILTRTSSTTSSIASSTTITSAESSTSSTPVSADVPTPSKGAEYNCRFTDCTCGSCKDALGRSKVANQQPTSQFRDSVLPPPHTIPYRAPTRSQEMEKGIIRDLEKIDDGYTDTLLKNITFMCKPSLFRKKVKNKMKA